MKKKITTIKEVLLLCLLLSTLQLSTAADKMGKNASYAVKYSSEASFVADSSRSLYVDGFHLILGNDSLENELLSYAQSIDVSTLLLYNLHIVHNTYDLTDPLSNTILADFISKAKGNYGIEYMGATAENGDYFTNVIDVYNNSRTASNEKFDIYNLEFEFWIDAPVNPGGYYCTNYLIPNGLACSNAGGFLFFISSLQSMQTLADNNSHPITIEAYVGWPSATQLDTIGDNLDRLRMHAYVADPVTSFSYTEERLSNYATAHPDIEVSIIFSAEPVFMQTWLENHSIESAENIYTADWLNASANWPSNVDLGGFTYYVYSDMSDITLEACPDNRELKDIEITSDTTIYARNMIELDQVILHPPSKLTLIAPEVDVSIDCEIMDGATLIVVGEDGCEE